MGISTLTAAAFVCLAFAMSAASSPMFPRAVTWFDNGGMAHSGFIQDAKDESDFNAKVGKFAGSGITPVAPVVPVVPVVPVHMPDMPMNGFSSSSSTSSSSTGGQSVSFSTSVDSNGEVSISASKSVGNGKPQTFTYTTGDGVASSFAESESNGKRSGSLSQSKSNGDGSPDTVAESFGKGEASAFAENNDGEVSGKTSKQGKRRSCN